MYVKIVKRSEGATATSDIYTRWYADKIGEVLEVEEHLSGIWYSVKGRPLGSREKFILKRDVIEVEKPMEFPKLESGMVVVLNDGSTGLVCGKAIFWFFHTAFRGNWMSYSNVGHYDRNGGNSHRVREIWSGATTNIGRLFDVVNTRKGQKLIWGTRTVELNSEYTAEILYNGKVKVGCQEFDLEKIKEIVKLAEGK